MFVGFYYRYVNDSLDKISKVVVVGFGFVVVMVCLVLVKCGISIILYFDGDIFVSGVFGNL